MGGIASILLALWFASSAILTWRMRGNDPAWAHAPIDVWSYVQAGLFTVIGVFALLGRRGARAWMFGGGLATVMHSAVAMRLNPWCGVAVALGAALAVTSVLWKDPSPAATA